MKLPKLRQELSGLRRLALDDLLAQSDDSLLQEAKEDGEDVDALAAEVRKQLWEVMAPELRRRLTGAKDKIAIAAAHRNKPFAYPALEVLKLRIQVAFETKPELGLAFREGKRQSESDWQSLYDDLIELGAITLDEKDLGPDSDPS